MAKIKSNVELVYDARNKKSGIVQIEISSWAYEPENNRYLVKVNDYVLEEIEVEGEMVPAKKLIYSRQVVYSKTEIDGLFFMLQNPIELTESYSDEMDNLISMALLFVTQQDPVYGVAENWEIVESN